MMDPSQEFFNLYNHDLIRVAVAVPGVRVADSPFNASQTIAHMRGAGEAHAIIAPELRPNYDIGQIKKYLEIFVTIFPIQPVQALLHSECSKSGVRGITFSSRRLPGSER